MFVKYVMIHFDVLDKLQIGLVFVYSLHGNNVRSFNKHIQKKNRQRQRP